MEKPKSIISFPSNRRVRDMSGGDGLDGCRGIAIALLLSMLLLVALFASWQSS